ncbi:MAG: competence protein ComFC [Campylobacterota bacterium]|nr:competence protein ComFC [Campylobacterota bacterium]MDQ1267860.1 competence protein ComFC [Campylobacterota bacterium]MDQ1338209.1 competence protein ComFC [Campylobacterota bacterium]
MCEALSLLHICKKCQETFLTPSIHKRKIADGIEVISFYKYSEIKDLLHTKHTDLGYYIYSILAKNSLKKFAHEFDYPEVLASIAVDDQVSGGYSHTAVLNRALKSRCITPLFNKLRAKNRVSYSGKSREFRILNPRDFEVKKFDEKSVILVDDIITTSLTLTQAVKAMQKETKEVLFCLTLADASIN